MRVKLSADEKMTIMKALNIASIFYEKTRRKEDYFKVNELTDLLFFETEITALLSDENTTYYSDSAKRLEELLKEREFKVSAEEQGCKVYQLRPLPEGPIDPNDQDEIEADKYMSPKMKEIAKEHPEL
jgi:hypothetical protein